MAKETKNTARLTPYICTPERAIKDGLNILVYGKEGVGKTHLIGTAQDSPYMQNVLVLNIDRGTKTIAHRKDINAIDIEDFAHVEEVFWAIANKSKEFKGIRTVAIDSATALQKVNTEEMSAGKDVTLQQWGKSTSQMQRIFRLFKEQSINLIVTAWPKQVFVDENDTDPETMPFVTTKLGQVLMGQMDMVWYMYTKESKKLDKHGIPKLNRYLLTVAAHNIRAKTRGTNFARELGSIVKNPNLADIYELFVKSEGIKNNG